MEIRYSYKSVPTIKAFSQSNAFIRGLMGPFGSGKSSGCVIELLKRAMQQEPGRDGIRRTRWAVVRNTYPQLRDTSLKTVLDWLPEHHFGKYNSDEHTYYITAIDGCEIEIMFRALDNPRHIKNLLSLELTGAWVNEAREVPRAIIDGLQGRVGRFPAKKDGGATWFGIFMDTNPPDSDSWWYRLFEENLPDNAEIFKQPSGLSPHAENLSNLPDNYYTNLALGKDAEWVKVYVKGEYGFVIDGKPVYPEYNDNVHCQEVEPTPKQIIYRGWDFGLTPACVFTQLPPLGYWAVLDELVSEDMGIERFADEVIAHCARAYPQLQFVDYGDPAGMAKSQTDEKTCFDILKAKGIDIQPGEQSPTFRQEAVKKRLNTMVGGKPGMLLHPRCKTLRKGFQGGYQFRRLQTSAERFTYKPDKNHYSHPHDALQYVATRLFGSGLTQSANEDIDYSKLYGNF